MKKKMKEDARMASRTGVVVAVADVVEDTKPAVHAVGQQEMEAAAPASEIHRWPLRESGIETQGTTSGLVVAS